MMNYFIIGCLCVVSVATFAKGLEFQHYPAKLYTGQPAKIQFTKDTYTFRTTFRRLSQEPANFAGHYVIGEVGCGGGCSRGMLYNLRTGKTLFLPYNYLSQCHSKKNGFVNYSLEYQSNSRLLKVIGSEFQDPCLVRYYVEQNGQLKLLSKQLY